MQQAVDALAPVRTRNKPDHRPARCFRRLHQQAQDIQGQQLRPSPIVSRADQPQSAEQLSIR
jgi:hypothetical protein